jgi:cephalosporin-C deacetylase-like acetyl esterase
MHFFLIPSGLQSVAMGTKSFGGGRAGVGLAWLVIFLVPGFSSAQIAVTPANPSGVYRVGDKVVWHVSIALAATQPSDARYSLKRNGLTPIAEGALDLSSGGADISTAGDQPGDFLLEINSTVAGRKIRTLAGALVSPEKIAPSATRPADFDEFWSAKIKSLEEIPANPQLTPADSGKPGVDYFKLQMDNIHGTHIYGQLAKPTGDGKYPALLILQWAGIYGLQKPAVVNRAQQGWLVLNIEPHDIPFDQPAAFYAQLAQTPLKDYYITGDDDRETSDFLRMYLSCYRAVDYLAGRTDWNGQTLVVMGTSMGGQQTIITAGLHPKVTAMMANVPSSCDLTGPTIGRAAAFPDWFSQYKRTGNPKILQAGRYFDPVNFASRVKCPAMVAMGLIDETCPAAGVYSAFNQIPSPKEAVVMVDSDHQGHNNTQAPFNQKAEEWLKALAKGEAAPVGKD